MCVRVKGSVMEKGKGRSSPMGIGESEEELYLSFLFL